MGIIWVCITINWTLMRSGSDYRLQVIAFDIEKKKLVTSDFFYTSTYRVHWYFFKMSNTLKWQEPFYGNGQCII